MIPFLNAAISAAVTVTATTFLFGPPLASRSGPIPRAPADAIVWVDCFSLLDEVLNLLNRLPFFFGSVESFAFLPSCVSFESRNYPGDFLRHYNYQLYRQPMDGTAQFRSDATFCPTTGKSGTGTSFASYNYPTRFLRHYNFNVYVASDGGSNAFDSATSWADDVSWVVSPPWAP